jgi:nucleoside-diphosphate-sugar epimerase
MGELLGMADRVTVVFGASSYVGSRAVHHLAERGHEVIAVSRQPAIAEMLVRPANDRIKLATGADVDALVAGRPFSFVNFAYVKDAPSLELFTANRRLVEAIGRTARQRATRIVQISTLAVFGYEPKESPPPRRASMRLGDTYVESKIHAEKLFARMTDAMGMPPVVVRLSNVIGPGSPIFVAGIAQRIAEGRPVGYSPDGFSNATHVANIADYVGRLLDATDEELRAHGPYHHMSEYSNRRWSEIVGRMADVVGRAPVYLDAPAQRTREDLRGTAMGLAKRAYKTRLGGVARAAFALRPPPEFLSRIASAGSGETAAPGTPPPDDDQFLRILSLPVRMQPHTLPGWTPPLAFAPAMEEIERWLRGAGYSLEPDVAR